MAIFYFARRAPKLRYYGDVIHSFYWKSAVHTTVVFKMRDSVPSPRYSAICNVLHQWKTSLIPTYRVYRLYDIRIRIIESVDSISRDERGFSLTQYITNGRISRDRYTITHFKHYHRVLRLIPNRMSV